MMSTSSLRMFLLCHGVMLETFHGEVHCSIDATMAKGNDDMNTVRMIKSKNRVAKHIESVCSALLPQFRRLSQIPRHLGKVSPPPRDEAPAYFFDSTESAGLGLMTCSIVFREPHLQYVLYLLIDEFYNCEFRVCTSKQRERESQRRRWKMDWPVPFRYRVHGNTCPK